MSVVWLAPLRFLETHYYTILQDGLLTSFLLEGLFCPPRQGPESGAPCHQAHEGGNWEGTGLSWWHERARADHVEVQLETWDPLIGDQGVGTPCKHALGEGVHNRGGLEMQVT